MKRLILPKFLIHKGSWWENFLCENLNTVVLVRGDMEELRNLEKVQRMLEFMDSRGVSNSNHHSNRFLANFIIFMIQPCEGLDINDKCCVLSYFIPTVSSASSFHLLLHLKWNLKLLHFALVAVIFIPRGSVSTPQFHHQQRTEFWFCTAMPILSCSCVFFLLGLLFLYRIECSVSESLFIWLLLET